jgi:hypothetical protein
MKFGSAYCELKGAIITVAVILLNYYLPIYRYSSGIRAFDYCYKALQRQVFVEAALIRIIGGIQGL